MSISDEKRKELFKKVKKLLKLAESANEHEAALAASRAADILEKYNLDMAEMETEPDEVDENGVAMKSSKPAAWMESLLFTVVGTYFCRSIVHGKGRYTIVGSKADVEVARYTFDYLYGMVDRLADAYIAERADDWASGRWNLEGETKKKVRYAYSRGVVNTVRAKLFEIQRNRKDDQSDKGQKCRDLVVVKNGEIKKYIDDKWGKLTTKKTSKTVGSRAAFENGKVDGKRVNISSGGIKHGGGVKQIAC